MLFKKKKRLNSNRKTKKEGMTLSYIINLFKIAKQLQPLIFQ